MRFWQYDETEFPRTVYLRTDSPLHHAAGFHTVQLDHEDLGELCAEENPRYALQQIRAHLDPAFPADAEGLCATSAHRLQLDILQRVATEAQEVIDALERPRDAFQILDECSLLAKGADLATIRAVLEVFKMRVIRKQQHSAFAKFREPVVKENDRRTVEEKRAARRAMDGHARHGEHYPNEIKV